MVTIASITAVGFISVGSFGYITTSSNPQSLETAKKTIRNALVGLAFVLAASTISSVLTHVFINPVQQSTTATITLPPIQPIAAHTGLTQVLVDAIAGLFETIVLGITKTITEGILTFLTNTPLLSTNTTIFRFWLIILGITDSLFVLVISLLGFQIMSASALGFDEIDVKHVLSQIALAFLGANISLFLIDRIIQLRNALGYDSVGYYRRFSRILVLYRL